MDRSIVYPGSLPQDTDFLYAQQAAMIAQGFALRAILGTGTIVDGLVVTQTASPSLSVLVGPGSLVTQTTLEGTAYGSIGPDTADNLMKMGINYVSTTLGPFTAPVTGGQSVNILVQGAFSEADGTAVVLPYYNAANPAAPYAGPANAGTPNNTRRRQTVTLSTIVGTPATTGSQTTPAATQTPLAVITIANGDATILNAKIAVHPNVPVLPRTMANASPVSRKLYFTSTGAITAWTVPPGVTRIKVTVTGAGGGGAGASVSLNGGNGGAGGTAVADFTVAPGLVITGSVGTAGTGGATTANGVDGGDSTAVIGGTTLTGSGGKKGNYGATPAGGIGGAASNGDLNLTGGTGSDGGSGQGGASMWGGGGRAAAGGGSPANGVAPGSGAGGSYGSASTGGTGANGIIVIEY